MIARLDRLYRRWLCHGSFWCCQNMDEPNCNSWNEPHFVARFRYRWRARREA